MRVVKLWLMVALAALLAAGCGTATVQPVEPVEQQDQPAQTAQEPAGYGTTEVPPTEEPPAEEPPTEAPGPVESGEVEVLVVDSAYQLKVINVTVGTTITWKYTGSLPHTVTADDGSFNSPTLGEGDTFTFTFEEAGTFPYFCRFHGSKGGIGMSGVVNVTDG